MERPGSASQYATHKMCNSFFRYALVGLLSNAGGYAIYLIVTWLGVSPKTAMSCLYFVGASLGFLGNRHWVFSHRGKVLTSLFRYGLAHLLGYGLNFFMLMLFVDQFGYPHQLVQAAAIFLVAGVLFLTFRFFVFSHTSAPDKLS
jgi:putative flippase GtrA